MTEYLAKQPERPRWRRWALWIAQLVLALACLAAGSAKLAGVERMVTIFDQIGIGQWFRYFTGSLEIVAAGLVLVPATAAWGAGLILCIMAGAVYTHLALIGGSAVPALALATLAAFIAWERGRG